MSFHNVILMRPTTELIKLLAVTDPGEGPHPPLFPLFLNQTGAPEGRKKKGLRVQGSGWPPHPKKKNYYYNNNSNNK